MSQVSTEIRSTGHTCCQLLSTLQLQDEHHCHVMRHYPRSFSTGCRASPECFGFARTLKSAPCLTSDTREKRQGLCFGTGEPSADCAADCMTSALALVTSAAAASLSTSAPALVPQSPLLTPDPPFALPCGAACGGNAFTALAPAVCAASVASLEPLPSGTWKWLLGPEAQGPLLSAPAELLLPLPAATAKGAAGAAAALSPGLTRIAVVRCSAALSHLLSPPALRRMLASSPPGSGSGVLLAAPILLRWLFRRLLSRSSAVAQASWNCAVQPGCSCCGVPAECGAPLVRGSCGSMTDGC